MRRREFLGALCGVASVPMAAIAQSSALPVVGFLHSASPGSNQQRVRAFLDGLNAMGYVTDRNATVDYRWANGQFDLLPKLANELVRRPATAIAAFAPSAALAAKSATATIPVVFFMGGDPVKLGLVQSFNRPGGNVTGVSGLTIALVAKRLELIRTLVPKVETIAFVVNPSNPTAEDQIQDMRNGAQSLGQRLEILRVSNEGELNALSSALERIKFEALIVGADSFLISQRHKLVEVTARRAVPAVYETRDSVVAGGLASYAPDFDDAYRQTGLYVGRILKGERPADLPVLQPTKFELVVNLKTARTLGLAIPPAALAVADEVIE
jgi:putative ABC transport system substrate-binding protein